MAAKRKKVDSAARRAHQRNVERAEYRAKVEKRNAFVQKYRKQLTIGIPALVLVIIGAWLVCKATIGPGGSIPNFFGHLMGVEENWIVTNQGTSSAPRYYKMGTFQVPEGYTRDKDYNVSSDALSRVSYCTADDADAPVQTVYVSGVQGKTAAEMIETVGGFGMYASDAVQGEGNIAGLDAMWITGLSNDDENAVRGENGEDPVLEIGHRMMTLYADSVQGGCLMVFLNSERGQAAADIPDAEAFMACAEDILAGVKVEK